MTDHATDHKCAHKLCSCLAAPDSKFCSKFCEDSTSFTTLTCDCGHAGCKVASAL
jgi:hypothetical protein